MRERVREREKEGARQCVWRGSEGRRERTREGESETEEEREDEREEGHLLFSDEAHLELERYSIALQLANHLLEFATSRSKSTLPSLCQAEVCGCCSRREAGMCWWC